MAFQSHVTPAFVVVQADFSFLIFVATFDPPPRERHPQQRFQLGVRRGITDEVLDFLGVGRVASHDQMIRFARQAVRVFQDDQRLPDFPHDGAFGTAQK